MRWGGAPREWQVELERREGADHEGLFPKQSEEPLQGFNLGQKLRYVNEIMSFAAAWTDLEMITLSEVSRTEKDKHHMIALICESKNMIQMNLFTKQK